MLNLKISIFFRNGKKAKNNAIGYAKTTTRYNVPNDDATDYESTNDK